MPDRRWDTDERGAGVGSAAAYLPDLQRLAAEMVADTWVAEEPAVHLLPHLQRFCEGPESPFRLLSTAVEPDGTYSVALAWTAPAGSAGAQRQAVYALVGTIAEQATYVHERREADGTVFEMVTGLLEGAGTFRGHGHTLRLRIKAS
jgi:hypothetical protein